MASVVVAIFEPTHGIYFASYGLIDGMTGISLILVGAPIAGIVFCLSALLNMLLMYEDYSFLYQNYEIFSGMVAPLVIAGLLVNAHACDPRPHQPLQQ
jgi:hypothetical protein